MLEYFGKNSYKVIKRLQVIDIIIPNPPFLLGKQYAVRNIQQMACRV